MDTRATRRAAEKAARTLINSRPALVGELGVRHAERARLADDVAAAAARGRQLVADAQAEAAHLVADAQDLAQDGEQHYAAAYSAATTGGWTADDLIGLGFQPANNSGPRRRRALMEQPEPTAPVVRVVAVPEQPADREQEPAPAR